MSPGHLAFSTPGAPKAGPFAVGSPITRADGKTPGAALAQASLPKSLMCGRRRSDTPWFHRNSHASSFGHAFGLTNPLYIVLEV